MQYGFTRMEDSGLPMSNDNVMLPLFPPINDGGGDSLKVEEESFRQFLLRREIQQAQSSAASPFDSRVCAGHFQLLSSILFVYYLTLSLLPVD